MVFFSRLHTFTIPSNFLSESHISYEMKLANKTISSYWQQNDFIISLETENE